MESVTVLDGGFSTQLSSYVGDIIDGDPLWSARFLASNPSAVRNAHFDFLAGGAEIIITNSYQASIQGFKEYLNLDEKASIQLIEDSVTLAKEARKEYEKLNKTGKRPLIAGSIGSYGASLHDGSEYTGSFIENISRNELKEWHRPRLEALIRAGVDLLAIETIPVLEEAEAILDLLKEFPKAKAWLSFQCQDGQRIARGDDFCKAVKRCWDESSGQLVAVGCNCLDPDYVSPLLRSVKERNIPFVVYPNSGEKYSPSTGWSGESKRADLQLLVHEWLSLGAKYIGGCCRTDAKYVRHINKAVKSWLLEQKFKNL